jgi:hypothetical protein
MIIFTWSARNAFSIVSSTGPSSAPLAFTQMRSITRRRIAHSSGSRLPGVRCSTLTLTRAFPGFANFQDFRAKRDNKLINLTACIASWVRVPFR